MTIVVLVLLLAAAVFGVLWLAGTPSEFGPTVGSPAPTTVAPTSSTTTVPPAPPRPTPELQTPSAGGRSPRPPETGPKAKPPSSDTSPPVTTAEPPPPAPPPPPSALPAFPWPPPRYSAFATVMREWVAAATQPTLASAAARLERAFDAAGYGERSYYWVPGGFALVSRL